MGLFRTLFSGWCKKPLVYETPKIIDEDGRRIIAREIDLRLRVLAGHENERMEERRRFWIKGGIDALLDIRSCLLGAEKKHDGPARSSNTRARKGPPAETPDQGG